MFAIRNIKTGKFVSGTNYCYYPRHQITSRNKMLTYDTLASAKADYISRGCGKDYRIVLLKTVEVKRVIDFDSPGEYDIQNGDWRNYGAENA